MTRLINHIRQRFGIGDERRQELEGGLCEILAVVVNRVIAVVAIGDLAFHCFGGQ